MTWGNPPAFVPTKPKKPAKAITPEMLATGSEAGEQSALFCWAALSVGKYPQLKWLYHIPNGGLRDIRTAANLKAEGVKAGVPDICLPYSAPMTPSESDAWYHGCYIELKIEKRRNQKNGGCSEDQLDWIDYLQSSDYYVAVCYGWKEARDTLIAYFEGKL